MEKLLGRTWNAICVKARKIGLSRNLVFRYGHGGWPLGKPRSEEDKRKIRAGMDTPEVKEKLQWMKGKHHSEESKLKRAETLRKIWYETPETWANRNYEGSGNPNWRGGVEGNYPWEFSKIKEKIKIRDVYTCQECGVKEGDCYDYLDVHHIDTNKENNDPSNLVTLCPRCHGLEHRKMNALIMAGA